MHVTELDALYAFLTAAAVAAVLTPLTMRLARAVGAIDTPRARGLSDRPVPLLGGLAILAGTLVAALVWLPAREANLLPSHTGAAHAAAPAHAASQGRVSAVVHAVQHLLAALHAQIAGLAHATFAGLTTPQQDVVHWYGVFLAGALIALVGALDDRFDLHPLFKLAGQLAAAVLVVHFGVVVRDIAVPFVGTLQFPHEGPEITVVGLVAMMNVVNFSDGIDGLAAGVSAIIAAALAVIAISLYLDHHLPTLAPAVFAALIAGGALGFLVHNFPPASSFMGDCGANLLGLLMGVLAVEATVKTEIVISFVVPLILLTVPFLDTTFVVLKRLKYRRPVYRSDSEHFHHRMARIGFSPRRTLAYLYAWTLMLAGLALALRFVPYSNHHGHLRTGWTALMAALGVIVLVASVYLVYLLEILKFRRLDLLRLRRLRPHASESELEGYVTRDLETGEMEVVRLPVVEQQPGRPEVPPEPSRIPPSSIPPSSIPG
jgi:UDP-GlcNAc:undecaprenyl-phosphate GlcNAc-1-phosphate transferase